MNTKTYKVIEDGIEYTIEEHSSGNKYWWFNGKRHRINKPACECVSGTKYWWFNNKSHRINGPAIEFANGDKYWYLNGKEYSKKEYYRELVEKGLITKKDAFIELI